MHTRTRAWELQQSLNDHLLTTEGAAGQVGELLALAYRERAAQSGPLVTYNILPAPLLLDAADHERLASDMASFTDLLLDLPGRLYGHDLERMCHDIGLGPLETATICATVRAASAA